MVSAAILFFELHGPASKTGLSRELSKREQRIAFYQEEIRKINAELDAGGKHSVALGFDEDTGLFHFRD